MSLAEALDAYRDAVAKRAYWEHNGTRRDGKLETAHSAELRARTDIFKAVRAKS